MADDLGIVDTRLPVPSGRSSERTPLSLEMDREGVRLRLASAVFDDLLALEDLVLRVPYAGRSFDYGAGPRILQSAVTRLVGVVVHVPLQRLVDRVRPAVSGPWTVSQARGSRDRIVLSGALGSVPFTVRVRIDAAPRPGSIRLGFESPCLWAPSDLSWDLLPGRLVTLIPEALCDGTGGDRVEVQVLRPVLVRLTASLGYKVPLLDGITLVDARIQSDRVSLVFAPGRVAPVKEALVPAAVPGSADKTARAALDALAGGIRDPVLTERFLLAGVAVPRLAPEVLARARDLGEERPESVLPHLVAAVVLSADPHLVPEREILVVARRLVAAVEAAGDPLERVLAGRLLARIALALSPGAALAVLDDLRIRGVEDASVLEVTALALDRSGRHDEARTTRSRAIALVPVGRTATALRDIVDRLEAAGLETVAAGWLEQTIAQCDEGAFGSEGGPIRRQAVLLLATRESLSPDRTQVARGRLRDLLQEDPCDREALDLLRALASCGREAAEAVARCKRAADVSSGDSRAGFLVDAAAVTMERLGLRHQATELLEAAHAASPRNEAIAAALDRLCRELDLPERRLALIMQRLAWTDDPVHRAALRFDGAVLADGLDKPAEVLALLDPLLEEDPTHVSALRLSLDAARAMGDATRVARARASLADLDPEAMSAERRSMPASGVPPATESPAAVSGGRPLAAERGMANDSEVGDDAEFDRFEAEARWLRDRVRTARAALDSGDAAGAFEAAMDALQRDPVHVGALRLAVNAATAAGRLDEAAELGRRWIDRLFSPDEQVSALIEMADIERLRFVDSDAPGRLLARAAAIAPEDPRVLASALGMARLDPDKASALLVPVASGTAAGAMDRDSGVVVRCADRLYEVAGVAWDELGAIDAATAILEVVAGLAPDHEAVRSDLAILYQASGRVEAARAVLEDG